MRMLRREICCLQHGETESNVWNTFVWSCPTWPSRWGMHISIDWPRLKSCQAVCDECTRGEIYSSLSGDAGCLAMWSWRESCVTKIWGSGAWSRIRVISFRYHGFPYSTIGDFLDPNIRVIRGPYCNWTDSRSQNYVHLLISLKWVTDFSINIWKMISISHFHTDFIFNTVIIIL